MSTYRAPLKDMQFALQEIAGLSEVTAVADFAEVTPEVVGAVLAEAAKFAAEVLDPLNRTGDTEGARFRDGAVTAPRGYAEAYRKFVEAGWNGLTGDPRYGGQALPHVVAAAVQEMWNSANMSFCLAPMLTSGVLEALRIHGSPDQQASLLPKLTSGEWTGTMNLTSPQSRYTPSGSRQRSA
jgi:alkylation response protein AidB-like acyl-CoA dehydrogenase